MDKETCSKCCVCLYVCVFRETSSVKSLGAQTNMALPCTHPHTHTHTHTHTQRPSLASFRALSMALHDAINVLIADRADHTRTYLIDDASLFNMLVISCFKSVPHFLSQHLARPLVVGSHGHTPLPSSLKGWSKVRTSIKVYLSDLLQLLETLKESSMRCAILKHIQCMEDYFLCYPKLAKRLVIVLVSCWSEAESHVQVMAFVVLRRITILQPHPALHHLLKVHTHTHTHTHTPNLW